jgi:hypothetical protein
MQAVQLDRAARGQPQTGVDGRHVLLHEMVDTRLDQAQAREEKHPVRVVLGAQDGERMRLRQLGQLLGPPAVRLEREDDVRIRLAHDRQQGRCIAVALQDVGEQQPDTVFGVAAIAVLHLRARQPRVRQHVRDLQAQTGDQQQPKCLAPGTCVDHREVKHQHDEHRRGDLHAREVEDPHPPGLAADQRQQRCRCKDCADTDQPGFHGTHSGSPRESRPASIAKRRYRCDRWRPVTPRRPAAGLDDQPGR